MIFRKNFGIVFLSGAVALGAIVFAVFSTNMQKGETSNTQGSLVVAETPSSTISTGGKNDALLDVDNDGVPTWKEILLGTDPNNPDSDGNGVLDGDEIAARESLDEDGETSLSKDEYVAPRGLTSTEALARELFASYASVRTNGGIGKDELETKLEAILSRRVLEQSKSNVYTLSSFNIEDDVSVAAYEGSLAQALKEANDVREYELNVFARAVAGSNEELEKIKTSATVYKKVRDQLLSFDVPTDVASEHLALINDVEVLASATSALGGWGGDPLDALVLVNNFSAAETNVGESLSRLYTFLRTLKKQS